MWGAIASAGASILGGLFGGSSAKKAAKAQAEAQLKAQREALAYQQQVRDENKALAQPFQALGAQGLNALSDPSKNFTTSPGYQFRLDQGLAGVTNNKAVGGMLNSGSTLKGLSDYGQNTASNEFGNWWGQQMGLVGVGQNALNSITGTNSAFGNAASGIAQNMGDINANYQGQKGLINQNMIGTVTGAATAGLNALSGTGWGSILSKAQNNSPISVTPYQTPTFRLDPQQNYSFTGLG